ncbi:MAG: hypothetical protein ACKOKF_07435, partial [Bacteroidota bacterium]
MLSSYELHAMSKTVLRYEEEEFCFHLIGSSTTYPDFRLCGDINQSVLISLARDLAYTCRK